MRIASFNLNNLFSRYDFTAEVDRLPASGPNGGPAPVEIVTTLDPAAPDRARFRTFKGRLVKGKPEAERRRIAERIAGMNADVLAVQEVEDITTLSAFAAGELKELGYRHVVLVEGNDPRLIDVGLLSRLPVGGVTSWRHAVHHPADADPVFSRDLLQVEILSEDRSSRLVTLFVTHLKSKFCDFREDPVECARDNDMRRQHQAEVAARIIAGQTRPRDRYLLCGDMNDAPGAATLAPLTTDTTLNLVDGLAAAVPDRPAPLDSPAPPDRPWSDRFKMSGKPADYELLDQIWLAPTLAGRLTGAGIGRRAHLTGDGSDHDPVWVDLDL
ncbi:MAG TPA: endonuclease/exonuclease/phosphatase family protein [Mycobacteriales bacterium]|nr:endonuclease/exonuclease/phosphatase family protein [Mycobacteriales bacterium]